MTVSRMRLLLALCFMLALSVIPLPNPLEWFRPLWVLMFMLYWQASIPKGCSVAFICLAGLALDALNIGVMGQHACALLLTVWIASKDAQRFRLLGIGHQMLRLVFLCFIYQFVLLLTGFFFGYPTYFLSNLLPIVTTVLFWPWMQLLADRIFLTFSIKSSISSSRV